MHSFSSRHQESGDKIESMTEILQGKYFPLAELCPLRIDVTRFPILDEGAGRQSCKGSKTAVRPAERLTLPSIQGQEFDRSDNLHMNAEEELQELDSCYKPSDSKACDLNLDFTGPSSCKTDFATFPHESLEVVLGRRERKMEESHALKRWEHWMRDKRRMQEYLGKRLQRDENRLLLQDSDKIRKKLEERWLSAYTRIPQADKWRGHPFRWKAEFRLPNRKIRWTDPKVRSPPQYCAVRTCLDKGEIPEMEFIGIPLTVQKEKGFIEKPVVEKEDEPNQKQDSESIKNRKKQLKPHNIDMAGLEVIGKKIIQPTEVPEEETSEAVIPEIIVDEAGDNEKCDEDPSVFCLVIDGEEIKYIITSCNNAPSRTFHWRVDFNLNTVGVLAERVLKVENRGTVAIRYDWLSVKPQKPMNLEKLQPRQYEPWFFFNKNSGFFLPGQIHHLKFYHHSKFPGIRKEVWHLKTDPPLSLSSDPCTVTLSAIATEEISSINPLETYMFNRVKMSIVKTMIDAILEKALRPCSYRGIEYRSFFSDKILFEYNNPERYYNSTIVNGLNKIYEEVTPGPADWDLSIDTLVDQVKAQRTGKERNSTLLEIAEKANLLFKPTYVSVSQDKKYRMAYAILCKMTNFMEDDYYFFRTSIFQKMNPGFRRYLRTADENSNPSIELGEFGEYDYLNIAEVEIDPINFLFFKIMFYLKVYYRMCQAVEHIVAMIETRKLFEPWKNVNYKIAKPRRNTEDQPHIPTFAEF